MKKHIAVSASLATLLALAAIGAKHFHDTYEITRKDRHAAGKSSDRSLLEENPGAKNSRQSRDGEDMMRRAQEWNERLVAARPDLQIHYRSVPDEKNGLLQLVRFLDILDPGGAAARLPEDIESMRTGDTPWDSKKAAAWLEGKGELLARIEAIGLLTDRSCAGVNQNYLDTHIKSVAALSYMLQVQARLALEKGDLVQGEKSMRALGGLMDDLDRSEAPCLLSVVLASGLRTKSVNWAEESFPGKHGMSPGDLTWSRSLRSAAAVPDLAAIVRGEWSTMAANTLLPALMGEQGAMLPKQLLESPEASAELMANLYAAKVRELSEKDLLEIMRGTGGAQSRRPEPLAYLVPAGISAETQRAAEKIAGINDKILTSLLVGEARRALAGAAAAVALGEEPGSDPVSGEPYRIDNKSRTLLLPDEPVYEGVDAREIPVLR